MSTGRNDKVFTAKYNLLEITVVSRNGRNTGVPH